MNNICPRTLSGKHKMTKGGWTNTKFDAYGGRYVSQFPEWEEPKCIYCGIIDDSDPPERK